MGKINWIDIQLVMVKTKNKFGLWREMAYLRAVKPTTSKP